MLHFNGPMAVQSLCQMPNRFILSEVILNRHRLKELMGISVDNNRDSCNLMGISGDNRDSCNRSRCHMTRVLQRRHKYMAKVTVCNAFIMLSVSLL